MKIAVIGSGISGISHIQLAKNKGLKIISTDVSNYRIEQAIKFGAHHSLNAMDINTNYVKQINNGRLCDKIIVCSGAAETVILPFLDIPSSYKSFGVISTVQISPSEVSSITIVELLDFPFFVSSYIWFICSADNPILNIFISSTLPL